MKLRRSELRLPLGLAVRRVAVALLDDATDAAARVREARDDEALHDFRVAVRRLRSWLRAFREVYGPAIRKKHLRRLRAVARATNPARDLEVQAELATRIRSRALRGRLEARRDDAARSSADAVERFEAHRKALRARLVRYEGPAVAGDGEATLAEGIADRLTPHVDALLAALARVESYDDDARAHAARIRAKRLRYLLEPVARHVAGSPPHVHALETLQDALGALHDAHLLAAEVTAMEEEDGASASARASRVRARSRLEREMRTAWAPVPKAWSADGAARFARAVDGVAARLRAEGA